MNWCEETIRRLENTPKFEWTDDDYEMYWYAKCTLDSIDAERRYLNGELR